MNEIWKDVTGYEGYYQVSNAGRVKALSRTLTYKNGNKYKYKEVMFSLKSSDYPRVVLSRDNKRRAYRVHRLVASAFVPNPENKPMVNHINGIKHDNRAENLEWCTARENIHHAGKTGLNKSIRGESNHNSVLDRWQVYLIRDYIKDCVISQKDIAKMFNVSASNITNIKTRQSWKHLKEI